MGSTQNILKWVPVIKEQATLNSVDPYLIGGIICQESGGPYALPDGSSNNYAIRVEKAFWTNYFKNIMIWVKNSPSPYDDRWAKYPDIYSCSYGLMQIMLQTAYEYGFNGIFPTELCDPAVNINIGCKIIARKIKLGGSVEKALLLYNGGGSLGYPALVLAHRQELVDGRMFE